MIHSCLRDRFFAFAIAMIVLAGCEDRETPRSNIPTADSLDSQFVVLVGRNLAANLLAYMARFEHVHAVSIDTLRARLVLDARMLTELLAQYEREMQILDVSGGRAWQAIVDSLHADLTNMPNASDSELRPLVTAHQRRVTKLIEYHEAMLRAGRDTNRPPSGSAPIERHRPD